MAISCDRCDTRDGACQDCVVTVLASRGSARHLEAEELRALRVLADAGMIPPLRLNAQVKRAPKTPGTSRTWAFPATKAS
jgi:hypothetical protein